MYYLNRTDPNRESAISIKDTPQFCDPPINDISSVNQLKVLTVQE